MKKTLAFTLAETLVVVGIIGVVAALTLPNVNNATNEKEKIVKLKKIYQNLTDAYGRAIAVYGPMENWFKNDNTTEAKSTRIAKRMTKFMKVSKTCGSGSVDGCFVATDAHYFNGSGNPDGPYNYDHGYSVLLADGTAVHFLARSNTAGIIVDIDGPQKGKNAWDYDLFSFNTKNKTLEPDGNSLTDSQLKTDCFKPEEPSEGSGSYTDLGYCTAWVIRSDSMDYLKATNGTCPNGTVLSWSNTTCK